MLNQAISNSRALHTDFGAAPFGAHSRDRLPTGLVASVRRLVPREMVGTAILVLLFAAPARAQVQVFSDRSAFLTASGARAQPAWPNAGLVPGGAAASYHSGQLTLTIAPPSSSFYVGAGNTPQVGPDWTTYVAGNDIAISGPENLNVNFDVPMGAFGFDFAEPTHVTVVYNPCSPQCPCANSTFRVTLLLQGAHVATFDYNRPDDTIAFVGVLSDVPFNRAEIREMNGTCDDEYFGRMYTRTACRADFDGDGTVDFFDYDSFVNCFEGIACPPGATADFDADGAVDFFDYDAFVVAFELGC
ncbi:MAG: hypothetical protein AABZ53_01320 [Planctomycetota bacterium]